MSLKKNNFYQKYFSELALSLARINKFITKENPSVGCVVTDFNNNILSSGVTSKNGRPHAENNALIKLNKKITKKILKLFPTPDLWIIMSGNPLKIWNRKREIKYNVLEILLRRYVRFGVSTPNTIIFNKNSDFKKIIN